jgi:bacterioferritin
LGGILGTIKINRVELLPQLNNTTYDFLIRKVLYWNGRRKGENLMTEQKLSPATKVSASLLKLLNEAIARELQVAIQYMWQHVQWGGVRGLTIQNVLKSIAVTEMKHAEAIAERLYYLGEIPTTKPTPILVGATLEEMIKRDVKDEEGAIALYKKIIEQASKEGDVTTAFMFKGILEQEEDHHDTFTTLLENV